MGNQPSTPICDAVCQDRRVINELYNTYIKYKNIYNSAPRNAWNSKADYFNKKLKSDTHWYNKEMRGVVNKAKEQENMTYYLLKKYNSSLINLIESQKYNIELLTNQMRVKQKTVIKLKELINKEESNISKSDRNAHYYLENYKKNEEFYDYIKNMSSVVILAFVILFIIYFLKIMYNQKFNK